MGTFLFGLRSVEAANEVVEKVPGNIAPVICIVQYPYIATVLKKRERWRATNPLTLE